MERKWSKEFRLTENDVSDRSRSKKEQIDFNVARALQYLSDPDKRKRLESGNCIACFYGGSSLAGQAFTDWNCRACLKDQASWPNTNPPIVCDACSKKHKICKGCGADLHLRIKRSNVEPLKNKDE